MSTPPNTPLPGDLIHDLRNDLNAILASATVLQRGCTGEQGVFLQKIVARGRMAADRLEQWTEACNKQESEDAGEARPAR